MVSTMGSLSNCVNKNSVLYVDDKGDDVRILVFQRYVADGLSVAAAEAQYIRCFEYNEH